MNVRVDPQLPNSQTGNELSDHDQQLLIKLTALFKEHANAINIANAAIAAITSNVVIGTTPITSGTGGRVLYETAGNKVGEISGATSNGTVLTLTAPVLGAASATSINKVAITAPATNATLTITDTKTFAVNKSLTLDGSDSTTMTFPTTSATIARTDASQSFGFTQTFSTVQISTLTAGRIPYAGAGSVLTDSVNLAWDNSNARLNLGGAASTSGNDFYLQKTVNGQVGSFTQNSSTSTAAFAIHGIYNSANGVQLAKLSTGYTTAGLYLADTALVQNTSGNMLVINLASSPIIFAIGGTATGNEIFRLLSAGNLQFTNTANFTANGAVLTTVTGVGPTGASTTVQEWLTIKNAGGTTRYIPCF